MDPLTEAERKRLKELWNSKCVLTRLVPEAEVIFSVDPDPLGCWHQDSLTVVMSSSLLGSPHIDDVFLHEAAHALDYATRGMSPHDEVFRSWCRKLGVTEGFEKAKIRMEKSGSDRIISKVKKLLALTESPFENERTEAMKKAQALLAEHSLSMPSDAKDELYFVILAKKSRFQIWEKELWHLISLLTGAFVLKENRTAGGPEMRAFGDLETAESAGFFLEYFTNAIENEKKRMRGSGVDMRSYLYGILDGLIRRVGADDDAGRALILSSRRTREKFLEIEKIRLKSSRNRIYVNPSSYRSGMSESDRIWIPPKKTRTKSDTKLIEKS